MGHEKTLILEEDLKKKLSVIIAVLDSRTVFARPVLYFHKMNISKVEFIFLDDGSDPPLELPYDSIPDLLGSQIQLYRTRDTRPWTQPCARNLGALLADSPRLLMTDIDHILSKEAIEFCRNSDEDKVMFPRSWGVLDNHGKIHQKSNVLFDHGLSKELYNKRKLNAGMHHNTFMMKTKIFMNLGGYDTKFCGKYGGDDTDFSSRYGDLYKKRVVKRHVMGPGIYVYPDPQRDVKNLFHSLRKGK